MAHTTDSAAQPNAVPAATIPVTSPALAMGPALRRVALGEDSGDHDWTEVLESTPEHILQVVGELVSRHRADMATEFYDAMLGDGEASHFLSHDAVHTRLHASIQRWMETLFGGDHHQSQAMAALQRQVGEVHARAEIPVHLVSRGMRLLKARMFDHLVESGLSRRDLLVAAQYVSALMDLAFAEMSGAYVTSHEQGARTDEMFRMVTAGQNAALERHRQLAALTDWENGVLRALATGASVRNVPGLRSSSFGLWFQHKAPLLFNEAAELVGISSHVLRLDQTLIPLIVQDQQIGPTTATISGMGTTALRDFLADLEEVRFLVNAMFDRLSDLEAGRDVLTQLYNRRFLPTIMRRALLLSRREENAFGVLMLDVDHFKRVNDTHGHEMGDRVLQSVAALMTSYGRASDFYFRYGGEEFLAVLNEVDSAQAVAVAEKIRARIEAAEITLGEGRTLRVTISIGVAMHSGHPDYRHLINRADEALYRAKQTGRNRVCVAEE